MPARTRRGPEATLLRAVDGNYLAIALRIDENFTILVGGTDMNEAELQEIVERVRIVDRDAWVAHGGVFTDCVMNDDPSCPVHTEVPPPTPTIVQDLPAPTESTSTTTAGP